MRVRRYIKNAASKTLTQVYLSSRLQVTRTAGNQITIVDCAPLLNTYDRGNTLGTNTEDGLEPAPVATQINLSKNLAERGGFEPPIRG